jgi:hypothetical protein
MSTDQQENVMYSTGGAKLKIVHMVEGILSNLYSKNIREYPRSSVVDQVSVGWH